MLPLDEQIPSLKQDSIFTLASEGEWSLHDLLPHLLSFTGPANVSVASFSLSEDAVRVLNFCKECGDILTLHCIFDYTMRSHKIDIMLFLNNVADEIRTSPNHAKLFIIENDSWKVAVIGSANLTPNPRLEISSIFTTKKEFDFFKNIFSYIWEKAIPYT